MGHGQRTVPAFDGFVSANSTAPLKKISIDYYKPLNEPVIENSIVVEMLRHSGEATAEVSQKYVISTYDLSIFIKALPII